MWSHDDQEKAHATDEHTKNTNRIPRVQRILRCAQLIVQLRFAAIIVKVFHTQQQEEKLYESWARQFSLISVGLSSDINWMRQPKQKTELEIDARAQPPYDQSDGDDSQEELGGKCSPLIHNNAGC